MKEKLFEAKLRLSLRQPAITASGTHFETTLLLARKEACQRKLRKRISFPQFLARQIKFTGRKIWAVQGVLLLLVSRMLSRFYGYHITLQTVIKLLFGLSVLVLMTILPFLYRSVRYRMQEVEAASRFSCTKLLLAKIIVVGAGDISILGAVFLTTTMQTSLPAGSAFLYLCFPFLLAGSACLYILGHFTPRQFLLGSSLFCAALTLAFCVMPGEYAFLFRQSLSVPWGIACILLFAFCLWQLHRIIHSASYTEAQIA